MSDKLAVEDLRVAVDGRTLLGPVSLRVPAGGRLTLMGETGAGKSLLAQAVMGAVPAGLLASGAVWLDGRRIDSLARTERESLWGRELAMLPQEPWLALDPLMRARAQVRETHRLVAARGRRASAEATAADCSS